MAARGHERATVRALVVGVSIRLFSSRLLMPRPIRGVGGGRMCAWDSDLSAPRAPGSAASDSVSSRVAAAAVRSSWRDRAVGSPSSPQRRRASRNSQLAALTRNVAESSSEPSMRARQRKKTAIFLMVEPTDTASDLKIKIHHITKVATTDMKLYLDAKGEVHRREQVARRPEGAPPRASAPHRSCAAAPRPLASAAVAPPRHRAAATAAHTPRPPQLRRRFSTSPRRLTRPGDVHGVQKGGRRGRVGGDRHCLREGRRGCELKDYRCIQ